MVFNFELNNCRMSNLDPNGSKRGPKDCLSDSDEDFVPYTQSWSPSPDVKKKKKKVQVKRSGQKVSSGRVSKAKARKIPKGKELITCKLFSF